MTHVAKPSLARRLRRCQLISTATTTTIILNSTQANILDAALIRNFEARQSQRGGAVGRKRKRRAWTLNAPTRHRLAASARGAHGAHGPSRRAVTRHATGTRTVHVRLLGVRRYSLVAPNGSRRRGHPAPHRAARAASGGSAASAAHKSEAPSKV